MDRYNCFTTSGGRVTGEIVYQEGKVVKEEARSIEPGQYNATVLPRRLTSSVIQVIDSYQNHKGVVPPQASHQFQGHHELIEIPPNNPCMNVHNFNFQLSDVSIYNQQDRVDHIEQNISTCGLSQFSCLQLLQDEKTMYRSNSSYQMTQIRTAQTEKESFNKWQKFKKP
ncbi:RNA polymerase II elongation factor ELL2-like [Tupaia chinensis]|uniref:RNA polymerase II elongation factor ELL2-like n=1 Tax=Tupaia chinensis TaxID=246437 RepID=UPI000FFC6090|nr:RNA polymerase II elongation factor ELL2-like [Tupaia chinensis]